MRAVLFVFATILAVCLAVSDKKIVCYWGSWSVYREGDGAFDLSYIDPKLCTHMIYTFIGLSPNGEVKTLDPWCDLPDGGGKDNFNRFNKLREQNPSLKTMIAIGGWNEGSAKYSQVVGDPNLRRKMVDSIVAFVKKYKFDGFDLDWEYPVAGGLDNGGRPVDYQNFVSLLKELREHFDQEGLLLSAAVGAAEGTATKSYDIPEISKYLHFINLMAYDLHGSWAGKTGINAPLYAASSEQGGDAKLNVDAVIKFWLSQGAPAEKLVLGVPFYGRSFTLSDPQSNGIGALASAGAAGPYTKEAGMLGYNEICLKIKNDNWQVKYDEEQKGVYAFKGNQWVGYDDEKIIKEKTDYIKKYNLGGAMVWSIETDDFRGKCGPKLPLLNALHRELISEASSIPNSPKDEGKKEPSYQPQKPQNSHSNEVKKVPVSETNDSSEEETSNDFGQSSHQEQPQQSQQPEKPPQQPQQPSSNGKVCQADGYVRDPHDCTKFYYCQLFNGEFIQYEFNCPSPLVYDISLLVCNWAYAVQC